MNIVKYHDKHDIKINTSLSTKITYFKTCGLSGPFCKKLLHIWSKMYNSQRVNYNEIIVLQFYTQQIIRTYN